MGWKTKPVRGKGEHGSAEREMGFLGGKWVNTEERQEHTFKRPTNTVRTKVLESRENEIDWGRQKKIGL